MADHLLKELYNLMNYWCFKCFVQYDRENKVAVGEITGFCNSVFSNALLYDANHGVKKYCHREPFSL